LVAFLISIALCSYVFIIFPDDKSNFEYFSVSGIIATFGSALLSAMVMFRTDCESKFKTNYRIYYSKILKEKPWQRWQFLDRSYSFTNKQDIVSWKISNPIATFSFDEFEVTVYLPTVVRDFFDLPIYVDYFKLLKT
jgi:uncharacterized membrane protein